MYVLVLYQDKIWYVCPVKNVSIVRNKCTVKYSNNTKYVSRVMVIGHDKIILSEIISNISGKVDRMQDTWQLKNDPATSFSQVSQVFSKDVKESILFVDENLLQTLQSEELIQCLAFDDDINIPKFVLKQSRFKRLERVNKEDRSQEATMKSMILDPPVNKISLISADECSPLNVRSSKEPIVPKKTNIIKSNVEQDQSLSVAVGESLDNIPEHQVLKQPIFSSTLMENLSPTFNSKLQELNQNCNMNSQNQSGILYLELDGQPIDHSLLDLNLEISQLSKVLELNKEFSEFNSIVIDVDPFKHNILKEETKNFHRVNERAIVQSTEIPDSTKNIESEKVMNSERKMKPKIVSEEEVRILLPKKRKCDIVNNDLLGLSKIEKRKKEEKKKEEEREEEEEKKEEEEKEDEKKEEKELVEQILQNCEKFSAVQFEPEEKGNTERGIESHFNESGDDEDGNDKDDNDGDEYKPDGDEESSESEHEENREFNDDDELDADLRTEQTFSNSLNDTMTVDQNSKASAPDDRELLVDPTSYKTKKHFCMYCKKFQTKIARHLRLRHSDQEKVKEFMALDPNDHDRKQLISVLRKDGNHVYNSDRQFNNGKLIVCRRPAAHRKKKAEDFMACGNCKGQYSKLVIRHHWRQCTKQNSKAQRIVLVKGKKVSARLHERANADVRKHVFPYLREDEVVRSIRYDELLVVFANKQCEKYGTNQHLYQMIRARLRLLGRLLVAIKSLNPRIQNFTDIFQPRHYDFLIEAVKKVAVFVPETKTFLHPAVGSTLGTLVKQIGEVLRSEYIKKEEMEKQKKVENFLKLLAKDYGTSINRIVTETQTQHFRTKEVILPSTEDIKKLYQYLVDERNKNFKELLVKFSFKTWKKLAEMTLLSLIVFNRRRPGEMERLYIKNFQSCRGIQDMADREIYETLTPEGRALANRYMRFEIRGKRNRTVPVLIDDNLKECMDLILKHRQDAQVSRKNEYFFGMPSVDKDRHKYLGACYLLRQHAAKCGADFPNLLRLTQLRKHVATRCINLNLEGNQVTDLANFMGHHENIHKKIYRQPVAATDIVKMSKILQMVQGINNTSDDSTDDEAEPSTSNVTITDPSVSQDDTVYGPDSSKLNSKSCVNQSSIRSDYSKPKLWTDEARTTVLSAFMGHLENGTMPSGKEMQNLIDKNDCFRGRSVAQMRTWLHTYKKKMTHKFFVFI